MKTIQIAIKDSEYAETLRALLVRDGSHRVYSVDQPDLRLDGVIVVDGNQADSFSCLEGDAERFVVITRKGSDQLSRIWNAGVRHVVFEGDAPSTAHLAIIAAELRLPKTGKARASGTGPFKDNHKSNFRGDLSLIDSTPRLAKERFIKPVTLF